MASMILYIQWLYTDVCVRLSGCCRAILRQQAQTALSLLRARDRHSCQIKINRILKDVRAKYFILALGTN